jgi:hypothetical protein
MNLEKHLDYFDPLNSIKAPIHIIGCGAVGSTIAEMLTRMGVSSLNLYDFDVVTPHNIANQMFTAKHIHQLKTTALTEIIKDINPDAQPIIHDHGYIDQRLSGYIFLCVDDIDLRRKICEDNLNNPYIKAIFDFRMRLTDAQHYAADWSNVTSKTELVATMQFTHAEAKASTPVNACGTSLNIITCVRLICSLGLGNFINFVKTDKINKMILADASSFFVDAFV